MYFCIAWAACLAHEVVVCFPPSGAPPMHMSFIQWLLAISVAILECILVVFLRYRKLRRDFPFFTTYLVIDILSSGVLAFTVQGSSELYFYSFWAVTCVGMLFSFLVL